MCGPFLVWTAGACWVALRSRRIRVAGRCCAEVVSASSRRAINSIDGPPLGLDVYAACPFRFAQPRHPDSLSLAGAAPSNCQYLWISMM